MDPASVPFTEEVDEILSPFQGLLSNILWLNFDALEDEHIPAYEYLKSQKKNIMQPVSFSGPLSILERAQIINWFEKKISKNTSRKVRTKWNGLLPLAHAYTLFLTSRVTHQDLFEREEMRLATEDKKIDPDIQFTPVDYLNEGWRRQRNQVPRQEAVDVDLECLQRLEEEMFEVSTRAGPAGNFQWGLDVGQHQDRWYPYQNLPSHLNDGSRDGEEFWDECIVSHKPFMYSPLGMLISIYFSLDPTIKKIQSLLRQKSDQDHFQFQPRRPRRMYRNHQQMVKKKSSTLAEQVARAMSVEIT